MDEIRKQRAALQAEWDATPAWQKVAVTHLVVPMLQKLDAFIDLLEKQQHGHQT